jgi:probable phosphoglycerate mutase
MDTTIIAVRHGETEWNKIAKQQWHLDSCLTELGIRQAQAMANGLKKLAIDHFYSSDLGRALQTASIISETINKKYVPDSRLRERNLGILQGLTKIEFSEKYPEDSKKFYGNNPDYRIPGGESEHDRYMRCVSCIEELSKKYSGKKILIVAHGGVLASFLHKALEIPFTSKRNFSLFNASINVFSISENSEWKLETWGDVSQLLSDGLVFLDDN